MNIIKDQTISTVLHQLHHEASSDMIRIIKGVSKGLFRKLRPIDMKDAYIAIDESQGSFIYDLLIKNNCKHIVEFGTSFGISSIYLGAAAKENGGKVITSEILPNKCMTASENFKKAGLSEVIELRQGDALVTLQDIEDGIDFLLLDGWNELYLPIVQMLEPKFKSGAIIYTDNAHWKSSAPFINYIRKSDKYESQQIGNYKGGVELTKYIAK